MIIKSLKKFYGNIEFMRCCNNVCFPAQKPCLLNEVYTEQLQI